MARFTLSPSRIARYFFHECDRHLRFHATPLARRGEDGIPPLEHDHSPVAAAILNGGYAWEEEVVKHHLDNVHIAPGDGALHERTFDMDSTIELLRNIAVGEAIYQPTLAVPPSFLQRYQLDPELVELRPCRPDLVRCEEDGRLSVVDVKAADALKASHRVQVALYVVLLRELLRHAGIDREVVDDVGYIWLFEETAPQPFELSLTLGALETFLRDRLTSILTVPAADVPWHLFFRCEWCEYYWHCRREAETTSSVSLVPYLSVGARRYLRAASWGGKPVHTLGDLEELLGSSHASVALDACGSLRGRASRLRNALLSMRELRVVPHGASSLALPVFEQVRFVLSLQREPFSGRVYTAGFRRVMGKEIYDSGAEDFIFVANSADDCSTVRADFLKRLFYEIGRVHEYNRTREWRDQKTVQTYVFDGYEWSLFQELLVESVQDPELAPLALPLLFHFQDERLASEDTHPTREVPFPIIVMTGLIRELAALPAPLVLRLEDVSHELPAPGFDYAYEGNQLFCFELSNAMRSDAIFQAWRRERDDAVEWVKDEMRRRLIATGAVVDGLREVLKDKLFAYPPRFYLPAQTTFRSSELSQLEFVIRYESFMGAQAVRSLRTRPWLERVSDAISLPIKHVGGGRFEPTIEVDAADVEASPFFDHLLVPTGEDGERAQMSYDDYRYREAQFSPRGLVRIASLRSIEISPRTGRVEAVHVEAKSGRDQPALRVGDEVVLHPRFTDFTSLRLLERLREIDQQESSDFVELLRDPTAFATRISEPPTVQRALSRLISDSRLTRSQRDALLALVDARLTLVWGPPGTGKTYFLAQAISILSTARGAAGAPLRVAVTSFTHAATENLLQTLYDLGSAESVRPALSLYKLDRKQREMPIELLRAGEAGARGNDASVVIGGTIYSLQRAVKRGRLKPFEMLVVDEGSQMKLGELALATFALAPGGRLVIAGDDLQLPPIIRGAYPEPKDGRPGLQDSAFAWLRHRAVTRTRLLKECFRMNRTLTAFPAATLYGAAFQPATTELAERKITLTATTTPDPLVEWLLDPDWPLVTCILEDVQATAHNRIEAEIVARLAVELRRRLCRSSGRPWPLRRAGDAGFWRHGVSIVSPHHVQIRAIHAELASRYDWQAIPFVDTVDKMQGQQCEVVLVSYGVSDVETALAEAEFIYNRNRLNVATTRARSKCVTFLSRALLEPSFELLSNERAAAGLGHMHALIDFCQANGEQQVFHLTELDAGDGGRLTAIRARRDEIGVEQDHLSSTMGS